MENTSANAKLENDAIEEGDTYNPESTHSEISADQVRITQKLYSLREIYFQIEEGELDLAPDFQRDFVWKDKQQVRLIESILMGIPLPAFYFNQDKSGAYQVVDGVQRLSTIKRFMANQLPLHKDELATLHHVQDKTFAELEPGLRQKLQKTQITAFIIEPQTPDSLKYDIFNRVNTGGSPLTAQEIRHCISKDRSRTFLRELATLPSFDTATGNYFWRGKERDNKRMKNIEFVLRFCAFYLFPVEDYAHAASLDEYLLQTSRQPGPSQRRHLGANARRL